MRSLFNRVFFAGTRSWLWLVVLILALDQWTKQLITARFTEFESVVIFSVLDIMRLHNTGAAFSFLSSASGWQRWFFIILAFGVSIGMALASASPWKKYFSSGAMLRNGWSAWERY